MFMGAKENESLSHNVAISLVGIRELLKCVLFLATSAPVFKAGKPSRCIFAATQFEV